MTSNLPLTPNLTLIQKWKKSNMIPSIDSVVLLVDLDTRIARVVIREDGTHSGEAVRIFVENDRTFIFNEL